MKDMFDNELEQGDEVIFVPPHSKDMTVGTYIGPTKSGKSAIIIKGEWMVTRKFNKIIKRK